MVRKKACKKIQPYLPLAFGLGLSLATAGLLLLAAAAELVLGLAVAEGLGLDLAAFLGGGDTTSTTLTSDLSDRVEEPVSRRLRFGVDALTTGDEASNMISSF